MAIDGLFANISCSDEAASVAWYGRLFGRGPDARPMPLLNEWHFGSGGLQLYKAPEHAGHGTLTVLVSDIRDERQRLSAAGLQPGEIQPADYTTIMQMRDPDGNLVVFAQPGKT